MSVHWCKDKVLAELSAFDFSSSAPVGAQIRQYYDFYHINFAEEISGIEQKIGWFDAARFRLVLQYFKPPKPKGTVFVFHGYFDHTGVYGHLIRHLLQKQFAVIIYDLPGHGLSSGARTAIKSFDQYQQVLKVVLNFCKGATPEPFHAIGQSTGCSELFEFVVCEDASTPRAFEKIVLLAPLIKPNNWRAVVVFLMLIKPFFKTWKRTFSNNSSNKQFKQFIRDIDPLQSPYMAVNWIVALKEWIVKIEHAPVANVDMTIIQGRKDTTVDWQNNIPFIRQKVRHVDVHYLPEGRHHLVNESLELRQEVFTLIDEVLCFTKK